MGRSRMMPDAHDLLAAERFPAEPDALSGWRLARIEEARAILPGLATGT